jgi:hypothetical protein
MEQDKIRTFLRSSIGVEGRRRWGLVLALIGLTGRVQAGPLDMNQVSTRRIPLWCMDGIGTTPTGLTCADLAPTRG